MRSETNFTTKPINNKKSKWKKVLLGLALIVSLSLIGLLVTAGYFVSTFDKSSDTNNVATTIINNSYNLFSTELSQDENNSTRILLLGNGGGNHDAPDLTDTIIIANINYEKNTISLLSLPRDLYIRTQSGYKQKVNKLYYDFLNTDKTNLEALEEVKQSISNIIGMDIHYVARIDFQGFEKVVDFFGGIEVTLDEKFYDPAYPRDDQTGYTTFSLPEGTQTLDGKTALKFARSRHSSSDFDRSKRQHIVINAVRDKIMNFDVDISINKIGGLINSIKDSYDTDLSIAEIIQVFRKVRNFTILSKIIHDDPLNEGGFLYTPPKEDFDGAFILLPNHGNPSKIFEYSNIAAYAKLIFLFPEYYINPMPINIENGTYRSGIATNLSNYLERNGIKTSKIQNAEERPVETTTLITQNTAEGKTLAEIFKSIQPDLYVEYTNNPLEEAKFIIGNDYKFSPPSTY